MTKAQVNIITNEELHELYKEEERLNKEFITYNGCGDIDGLHYYFYIDKRNGNEFAVRQTRTVHMGFNSNEGDSVLRFRKIVEREGACKASWGVTGRTAHEMLARKLAKELPQYDWEIDYQYYGCKATKR